MGLKLRENFSELEQKETKFDLTLSQTDNINGKSISDFIKTIHEDEKIEKENVSILEGKLGELNDKRQEVISELERLDRIGGDLKATSIDREKNTVEKRRLYRVVGKYDRIIAEINITIKELGGVSEENLEKSIDNFQVVNLDSEEKRELFKLVEEFVAIEYKAKTPEGINLTDEQKREIMIIEQMHTDRKNRLKEYTIKILNEISDKEKGITDLKVKGEDTKHLEEDLANFKQNNFIAIKLGMGNIDKLSEKRLERYLSNKEK